MYVSVENPFVCCALIAIKVDRRAANEERSHETFKLSRGIRTRIEINKVFKM